MKKPDAPVEPRAATADKVPELRNGVPVLPRRPPGSVNPTLALVNKLRDE